MGKFRPNPDLEEHYRKVLREEGILNNENANVPIIDIDSVFQQMMRDAPDRHRVFVEEYNKVIEECRALVGTRNEEDYNQMVALPDYFPFGEYSYCHMLFLKSMRAINQILAGANPHDSLQDLINYAAFTDAWFRLRDQGRVPSPMYGPVNPQQRRSEMEKELFQYNPRTGGPLRDGEGNPAEGQGFDERTGLTRGFDENEADDRLRDEGASQGDQQKF